MILIEGPVRDYLAHACVAPGVMDLAALAPRLSHWHPIPWFRFTYGLPYDPATAHSRRPR
ncbi:MAG: hypothetical protein QOE76_3021 [Frankiales bacterium]|jgi:hypothetical protein|nr:hypothetical protein [Frankiales bacterium]